MGPEDARGMGGLPDDPRPGDTIRGLPGPQRAAGIVGGADVLQANLRDGRRGLRQAAADREQLRRDRDVLDEDFADDELLAGLFGLRGLGRLLLVVGLESLEALHDHVVIRLAIATLEVERDVGERDVGQVSLNRIYVLIINNNRIFISYSAIMCAPDAAGRRAQSIYTRYWTP